MATRRMFSREVMDSDIFIDMTTNAKLLYVYLNLNADDEGFISNPKAVARFTGLAIENMEELEKNGFIIPFNTGVIVVTHWYMHNQIRKDRAKKTMHLNELSKVKLKNKKYTKK